jgi:PAS domain S-box-containing protein
VTSSNTPPPRQEKRGNGSGHGTQDTAEPFWSIVRDVRDYAIFLLDPAGHVVSWNSGAEAIHGYEAGEVIGTPHTRFYMPADIEADVPAKELRKTLAEGRLESERWRLRKDGSPFWGLCNFAAVYRDDGTLRGFLTIVRDLTARYTQEKQLRESEERFRLLVEGVTDYAIFSLDPRGCVTSWNAGAHHIKGYEAKDIIGSHFSRFYPQEAIDRQWPEYELHQATMEGRFEDEGWRVRKDGTRFWANVIITALRDAHGTLLGFSKITRDLSERRRYEEQLRQSEERFRLLVEGVTDYAIIMLDASGCITSWNAGAEAILGHRAEEILWKHFSNLYRRQEIDASKPWHDLASARKSGGLHSEGWRVRKDGTTFWGKTMITPLRDAQGRPYGFAHVTQDLTQQRHSEALEDVARRMNEFIAMLGHELRNPLAPIRNAVALMGRKGLGDPVLESMRATIARQSDILSRIVDELLDVNRIARGELTLDKGNVDLAEIVSRAIESVRPIIDRRKHELHVAVPSGSVHVPGDALRLTQVVVNLLNNAAKYTPPQGQIWLSLETKVNEAELRIRDNGVGINRDVLPRIFDLFFQSIEGADPDDRGLGVGLALVRRIVELHGGRIQAHSAGSGRGSEFVLCLPLSSPAKISHAQATTPREETLPRRRVVVADDNVDAATTFGAWLETLGQDVKIAFDGASAIKVAQEFAPDVVLLDIGMPVLDGYEVARRLRSLPLGDAVAIVAVTGWGQDTDRRRAQDAGFDFHFVKPVSDEELRRVLMDLRGKK